jgi:hypothetical protein
MTSTGIVVIEGEEAAVVEAQSKLMLALADICKSCRVRAKLIGLSVGAEDVLEALARGDVCSASLVNRCPEGTA